ncbi:DoxX family protein [Longispora albida]|uniref:DoxX family protein n=1 Tax=Longispora albida TaxID=203523 RepID=UPI00037620D6|nr:DoxX family protein [Longispora albida]
MSTAHVIVTVIAALWIGFSAFSLAHKAEFVAQPLIEYGVPRGWWGWLAAAKGAGSLGLIVGLFVPLIGVAAAIGLILYFTGAVITVLRARSYKTAVFPVLYLLPAAASLTLGLLS